jgi:hypothetical protein
LGFGAGSGAGFGGSGVGFGGSGVGFGGSGVGFGGSGVGFGGAGVGFGAGVGTARSTSDDFSPLRANPKPSTRRSPLNKRSRSAPPPWRGAPFLLPHNFNDAKSAKVNTAHASMIFFVLAHAMDEPGCTSAAPMLGDQLLSVQSGAFFSTASRGARTDHAPDLASKLRRVESATTYLVVDA